MWFVPPLSNEALISISNIQLLHFSHPNFASPGSGLPARELHLDGEARAAQEAHNPSFAKSGQKSLGWEHSQSTKYLLPAL